MAVALENCVGAQVRADYGLGMQPKALVEAWVAAFNGADANRLAAFYADDATNHQVAEPPIQGREAIREMFAFGFAQAKMVCIVENLFEDGEWAILEWRDPLGLRGCGFFHVQNDQIVFQRGYWDKQALDSAFLAYSDAGDFVGMDMTRKFVQMGYTRSRRYANHKSGRKYNEDGEVAPRDTDPEKARAAAIFHRVWRKIETDAKYQTARSSWPKSR